MTASRVALVVALLAVVIGGQAFSKPKYESYFSQTDGPDEVNQTNSYCTDVDPVWPTYWGGASFVHTYGDKDTSDGTIQYCEWTTGGTMVFWDGDDPTLNGDILDGSGSLEKKCPATGRAATAGWSLTAYWNDATGAVEVKSYYQNPYSNVMRLNDPNDPTFEPLNSGNGATHNIAAMGPMCHQCQPFQGHMLFVYTDDSENKTYIEGCRLGYFWRDGTGGPAGQVRCGRSNAIARQILDENDSHALNGSFISAVNVRLGTDGTVNPRGVVALRANSSGNDGFLIGVGIDAGFAGTQELYMTDKLAMDGTEAVSHIDTCHPYTKDGAFAASFVSDGKVKVLTGMVYSTDDTPLVAIGDTEILEHTAGKWTSCAFLDETHFTVSWVQEDAADQARLKSCQVAWTSDTAQTITCAEPVEVLVASASGNIDGDAANPQIVSLDDETQFDLHYFGYVYPDYDNTASLERSLYKWNWWGLHTGRIVLEGFEGQLEPEETWNDITGWQDYGTGTKWRDSAASTGGMWIVEGHVGEGVFEDNQYGADPCPTCQSDFYLELSFINAAGTQDASLNMQHASTTELVAGMQVNHNCGKPFVPGGCVERYLIRPRGIFNEELCYLSIDKDGVLHVRWKEDSGTTYCGEEAFNKWTICDPNDSLVGNQNCDAEREPFDAQETVQCISDIATGTIARGTAARVALKMDTSISGQAGAVSCALWIGGNQIKSGTIWLGDCTDPWLGYAYKCRNDADCNDVANDPAADIGPCITAGSGAGSLAWQTQFGAERMDTGVASFGLESHYEVDDYTLDIGDVSAGNTHSRIAALIPNADPDSTANNQDWLVELSGGGLPADCDDPNDNHWECVDQTDLFAGGKGGKLETNTIEEMELFNFTSVVLADPNETVVSDAAVFVTVIAAQQSGAASNELELRVVQSDDAGTCKDYGRLYDPPAWVGEFRSMGAMFRGKPDCTASPDAWNSAVGGDFDHYDDSEAGMERVTGQTSQHPHVKRVVQQVEVTTVPDQVHLTLSDQNKDALITVGIGGDSRHLPGTIWSILPGKLLQVDYLYNCAWGGIKSNDILDQLEATLDGGGNPGFCREFKGGATGKPIDYYLLDIGINDNKIAPHKPQTGFCYDYSDGDLAVPGPQYGNDCQVASGRPNQRYCVKGQDYLDPCSYCLFKITDPNESDDPCYLITAGTSSCGDSTDPNGPQEVNSLLGKETCSHETWTDEVFCIQGDLDQYGCENGVCVQSTSPEWTADYWRGISRIIEQHNADPNDANHDVQFILMKPVEFCDDPAIFNDPNDGCAQRATDWLLAQHGNYQALADRYGYGWIDLNAIFKDKCPGNDIDACIVDNDCVHWNPIGQAIFADAVEGCLEADPAWTAPALGYMDCGLSQGIDPNGRLD